jgi:hypothetical protein
MNNTLALIHRNDWLKNKKSGRNAHFSGGFEPPFIHQEFANPDAITPIDPKSFSHEATTTSRARAN